MILPLSARYSSANLPAVGERVVYAPGGITAKGQGGVVEVRRVLRGTIWVLVQLDAEDKPRRVRPQNLFKAETPSIEEAA